ncbi:MAG TPA: type IV pili methyl-accepting chemotaxis transducer N-terminal domain-containing protein, partial [Acidiferrobacterales bacterium]
MAIVKLPRKGKAGLDQTTQDDAASMGEIMFDSGEEFIDVKAPGRPAPAVRDVFRFLTGLPFLLVGMVLSFIAVAWLFAIGAQQADRDSKYIEQSSQLLMLSQRIAKGAREAVLGQPEAFKVLKESRDRFAQIVTSLRDGSSALGIPASPPQATPALEE